MSSAMIGEKVSRNQAIDGLKSISMIMVILLHATGYGIKNMDIEPLKTKKIWYLVEVPQEVEINTQAGLIMQYQINGKTYNVKIR